jgi:ubiquinone/menaquinone biosynthesis C-methylase UbiE
MAEHCNVYDRAHYYDIIFDRDVSKEVQFIRDVYAKFHGPGEIESVLDVACGPGYHALEFAKQGVEATGLDLRAEMVRFAGEKSKKLGVQVNWLEADMRTVTLPKPVDVAMVMFDSLDCLTSNDDLIAHFATIARNLTSKGLYIVDLSHPKDIDFAEYRDFCYKGSRDGINVELRWATNKEGRPRYDVATGIAKNVEVQMHIDDNGKKSVVTDHADERLLFPQEMTLLARLSGGLEAVGWYGDFRMDQPLDFSPGARRMIGVFRKTS